MNLDVVVIIIIMKGNGFLKYMTPLSAVFLLTLTYNSSTCKNI